MSNFSFSHCVFYPFETLSTIFIKYELVVCKLIQFGSIQNLSFGKGLRSKYRLYRQFFIPAGMRDLEDYRAMDNVSTPLSSFHTLETLNNAEADVRLPSIIFLSVLLLVGICGNFCVWLVYGFKLKKHSTYKLTVLGIAFYDTLACCGGIPGNIIDLRNPLTFYSSVGCKVCMFN